MIIYSFIHIRAQIFVDLPQKHIDPLPISGQLPLIAKASHNLD